MASDWARQTAAYIQHDWQNSKGGWADLIANALDKAREEGAKSPPSVPAPVPCPTCKTPCDLVSACRCGCADCAGRPIYVPIAPLRWPHERGVEYVQGRIDGREAGLIEGRKEGERAALRRVYWECVESEPKREFVNPWNIWTVLQIPVTLWREIKAAGKGS